MKLTDLDPSWTVDARDRGPMGVTFRCPVHGEHCRLGVDFENPLDGGPPTTRTRVLADGSVVQVRRWTRVGSTFDDLTLLPSIHVRDGEGGPTHWHGFITRGEVSTC